MGMKIKRTIHGKEVEIELTHDELVAAYNEYEHYLDCEYVRNSLNSGCYEEFEDLTDEEWEAAVCGIAYEKRNQQDKYALDEWDALDAARKLYIKEHLNGFGGLNIKHWKDGKNRYALCLDGREHLDKQEVGVLYFDEDLNRFLFRVYIGGGSREADIHADTLAEAKNEAEKWLVEEYEMKIKQLMSSIKNYNTRLESLRGEG